jgi:hypothetical protein
MDVLLERLVKIQNETGGAQEKEMNEHKDGKKKKRTDQEKFMDENKRIKKNLVHVRNV